jgi:transposase
VLEIILSISSPHFTRTTIPDGKGNFLNQKSPNFTGPVYIRFLERLIQSSTGKLFWITDRHPVHFRKKVQQWLEEHSEQIEVFYLPSYSPQLNPVEYLNSDVKQGVHDKPPTRDLTQLKYRVLSHLRKLQKLPGRVMRYFQHASIAYAIA